MTRKYYRQGTVVFAGPLFALPATLHLLDGRSIPVAHLAVSCKVDHLGSATIYIAFPSWSFLQKDTNSNKCIRYQRPTGWLNELGCIVWVVISSDLSPIRRGFTPGSVIYKKGCTRLAAASDKVYQLLAHDRRFSPGTPASSTTKTGSHDIADILLKVPLKHKKSNQWIQE
jgi:hypothetical protein